MAEVTKIEWATHSWSPWIGCSKVHTGCEHCYAEAMARRLGVTWGQHGTRKRTSNRYWKQPLKWERAESLLFHYGTWQRPRIFPSLCDPFEDREDLADLRRDFFDLIDRTPHLDWLLLTKRPENIGRMWPPRVLANDYPILGWQRLGFPSNLLAEHEPQAQLNHGQSLEQLRARGGLSAQEMLAVLEDRKYQPIEGGEAAAIDLLMPYRAKEMRHHPNVWLIYSASDQTTLEAGLPHLLECRDLVPVLGLSLEPLVGPINLRLDDCWLPGDCHDLGDRLNWVIVGGESGPHARPCDIDWIRSVVEQCAGAGVPCFVKQLGAIPVMDYYGEEGLRERCLESDGRVFEPTRDGWMQWDWERDKYQPRPGTVLEMPLRDPKGGNPTEWPADLQVRQFPGGAK